MRGWRSRSKPHQRAEKSNCTITKKRRRQGSTAYAPINRAALACAAHQAGETRTWSPPSAGRRRRSAIAPGSTRGPRARLCPDPACRDPRRRRRLDRAEPWRRRPRRQADRNRFRQLLTPLPAWPSTAARSLPTTLARIGRRRRRCSVRSSAIPRSSIRRPRC